jgi:hypothetical protein
LFLSYNFTAKASIGVRCTSISDQVFETEEVDDYFGRVPIDIPLGFSFCRVWFESEIVTNGFRGDILIEYKKPEFKFTDYEVIELLEASSTSVGYGEYLVAIPR